MRNLWEHQFPINIIMECSEKSKKIECRISGEPCKRSVGTGRVVPDSIDHITSETAPPPTSDNSGN